MFVFEIVLFLFVQLSIKRTNLSGNLILKVNEKMENVENPHFRNVSKAFTKPLLQFDLKGSFFLYGIRESTITVY